MSSSPSNENGTQELHVCMGLNSCKGQGKYNTGALAGMGECATAVHDCHTLNACRGQGACGGGGSAGVIQTSPGDNQCAGKGSCGTSDVVNGHGPGISYQRTMQAAAGSTPGPYEGQSVWLVARKLFEERMMKTGRFYAEDGKVPSSSKNPDFYYGPAPYKGGVGGPAFGKSGKS